MPPVKRKQRIMPRQAKSLDQYELKSMVAIYPDLSPVVEKSLGSVEVAEAAEAGEAVGNRADQDFVVVVHEIPTGSAMGVSGSSEAEETPPTTEPEGGGDSSLRSQPELTVISIDEKSTRSTRSTATTAQMAIYDAPSSEIQMSYDISEDEDLTQPIPPELPPKDYFTDDEEENDLKVEDVENDSPAHA